MVRGLGYASDGLGYCGGGDWRHESQYSSWSGAAVAAVERGREREGGREAVPDCNLDATCPAAGHSTAYFCWLPPAQGELTADTRGLVEAVGGSGWRPSLGQRVAEQDLAEGRRREGRSWVDRAWECVRMGLAGQLLQLWDAWYRNSVAVVGTALSVSLYGTYQSSQSHFA